MEPVIVVGPDGNEYEFPAGTTKEAAIGYFKSKGIGTQSAGSGNPNRGSGNPQPASVSTEKPTPWYDQEWHPTSIVGRLVKKGGEMLGAPSKVSDIWNGPAYAARHPIDSAKMTLQAIGDAQQEAINYAYDERQREGYTVRNMLHGAEASIPLVGPALQHLSREALSLIHI